MKLMEWLITEFTTLIQKEYIDLQKINNEQESTQNEQTTSATTIATSTMATAVSALQWSFSMMSQTYSSAATLLQKNTGVNIPHQNVELRELKSISAHDLIETLKTELEKWKKEQGDQPVFKKGDQTVFLSVIKKEQNKMKLTREGQDNTDPGIYDSLLEVCARTLEEDLLCIDDKSFKDFESEFEEGDKSTKSICDQVLNFIIKHYFITRMDYHKAFTLKKDSLKRKYSVGQCEVLDKIFKEQLSDFPDYLEQMMTIQNPTLIYDLARSRVILIRDEINNKITQKRGLAPILKDLNAFIARIDEAKKYQHEIEAKKKKDIQGIEGTGQNTNNDSGNERQTDTQAKVLQFSTTSPVGTNSDTTVLEGKPPDQSRASTKNISRNQQ